MSDDVVIRAEGLGKRYLIDQRAERERYVSLRDVLARSVRGFGRKFGDLARSRMAAAGAADSIEEFWALHDVSFEVKRGEVVGIIGRNGAGKSTLLKILSRITEPSAGRITIKGRVASLLEVGTGFHPELTGRENIYLNGAILGMSRAEIRKKFDEIVAFAEVEKFLETPVKRYSSGMYVRLAFAVAAHLEPEILIVDEVLAVGDAEFQKKCLGKMEEASRGGRTVLFVSHEMRRVSALCVRGMLLRSGKIQMQGATADVVEAYLQRDSTPNSYVDLRNFEGRSGTGEARFESIELSNAGQPSVTYALDDCLVARVRVQVATPIPNATVCLTIMSSQGVPVHELVNADNHKRWDASVGRHELIISVSPLRIYPGRYSIDLWLGGSTLHRVDYAQNVCQFDVIQTPDLNVTRLLEKSNGLVFQPSQWTFRAEESAAIGSQLIPTGS